MESQKKLTRQVWRNNRSKITFTLHPDIVKVIKSTAEEERLPMSIVAAELREMVRNNLQWFSYTDYEEAVPV